MLRLKLKVSNPSAKFLDTIPISHFDKIVTTMVQVIKSPPARCKRIKGYDYRQCDIGRYRVVYDVVGDTPRILYMGYWKLGK